MTTPISEAARQAAERIAHQLLRVEHVPIVAAEIQRAIDQAAPAWRPIETAPKDGRSVLVWVEPGYWYNVRVAYRHPEVRRFYSEGFLVNPTHWQPLPPGPLPLPQEGRT